MKGILRILINVMEDIKNLGALIKNMIQGIGKAIYLLTTNTGILSQLLLYLPGWVNGFLLFFIAILIIRIIIDLL